MAEPDRWQDFAVVGIGNHARTKLIPAIGAIGGTLAAVVSRQSAAQLPDAPVFVDIDTALLHLPPNALVVIASPPALHRAQAMSALEAGFDVLVEKPAFVTADEVAAAASLAASRGVVLAEAFMHRHTSLYRQALDLWTGARSRARSIDIAFLVPALPTGTFRQGDAPSASVLYDIGCYALSLVRDLGIDLGDIALDARETDASGAEHLRLSGIVEGTTVTIACGVGSSYANSVAMNWENGETATFAPFFYGRPGIRTLTKEGVETVIDENDAFETMLSTPRNEWIASQDSRTARMLDVTAALERLGEGLAGLRRA